ncbi:MAG: di-heme enzyme [Myxococcales bacterium]|nr:di-heme enzyme [Myxococcales bacterium]
MRRALRPLVVVPALMVAACGCGGTAEGASHPAALELPKGFPAPKIPADNPLTEAKVELGRYLFYDPRLSGNGTQSCASCHEQSLAFTDGHTTSTGSTGVVGPRNVPSLGNVAFNATLTMANPLITTIEKQLLLPIFGDDPVELGAAPKKQAILDRLAADPRYPPLFTAAYPDEPDPIAWDSIVDALASFTRTMITGDSPFDHFVYGGDDDALTPSAKRGMDLFFSEKLECYHCHGGFNFTNASVHAGQAPPTLFHNTGLYNIDGDGAYPPSDPGLFAVTGDPNDMGRFRSPSLRNVAVTAPYMHDGSIATLDGVIRFYEDGGRDVTSGPYAGDGRLSPLKSGFMSGFTLSDQEREDLLRFLESLTDDTFLNDPRFSNPFPGGAP